MFCKYFKIKLRQCKQYWRQKTVTNWLPETWKQFFRDFLENVGWVNDFKCFCKSECSPQLRNFHFEISFQPGESEFRMQIFLKKKFLKSKILFDKEYSWQFFRFKNSENFQQSKEKFPFLIKREKINFVLASQQRHL